MYTDHAAAAAAATALCGDLSRSKSFRMKQVASLVVKDKQIQEKMLAAMSKSQAAAPVGTESLEFDLHEKMQLRATAQLPRGIRRTLQRRRTLLYHLFILVMGVLVGLIAFTLSKVNRFSVPRIRPFASQPGCLPAPPGVSLCAPPHRLFFVLTTCSPASRLAPQAISIMSKAKWAWVREAVHSGDLLLGWLRLVAACCGLVAVASALTYFAPEAAGSGIPHVKSYLNGNRLPGVLKLRVLFVKVRQDVSE